MKKTLKNINLLLVVFAFAAGGCDDLLDTTPKQFIATEDVFGSITGIQAAITASYNDLQPREYYGRDFIVTPEVLADNMRLTVVNTGRYVGQINNSPGSHIATWGYYRTINKLNNVIAAVDALPDGTEAQRKKAKGEAYFLRALCYFDMVRVYAYNPNHIVEGREDLGVPLITKPTKVLGDVEYASRGPIADVYTQIEADLLAAESLLGSLWKKGDKLAPNFASHASAQALLSRVYLYWGKWQNSARYATAVIDSAVATMATKAGYAQMFISANNPESIFELNYETTESLTSDALTWIYTMNASNQGYGDVVPTDDMLAQYDAGDVRKNLLKAYTKSGEGIFYNQKFPSGKGTQLDNVEILRLSEMYLNRAEAYTELKKETEAQADLNVIRIRAGLTAITPAGDALLQAVLKERRVELAYEGHRWFDLTRRGLDIPKATVIKFDDYRILAPIPVNETDVNKNLQQNFNY